MVIIVMGVSGSGKTTVGRLLAQRLGWPFHEGDDDHPVENRARMAAGIALTDADREPWLDSLTQRVTQALVREENLVIACSALKRAYRKRLALDQERVRFLHLHGSYELILERLKHRAGHFMPTSLLGSQFQTLESDPALVLAEVSRSPAEIVEQALADLGLADLAVTRTLLDGLTFPEGPRWHQGRLWFTDQHSGRVMSVDLQGRSETIAEMPDLPGGLGWLPDGTPLVVAMTERRVYRLSNRGLELHCDLAALASFHCNDMLVLANGRAYVGNFGFDLHGGAAQAPAELICVEADGSARVVADGLIFPNGMALTDDGNTLIVAETFANRLTAFRVETNGGLAQRRVWADLADAHPDGICLTTAGNCWVACPNQGELREVREGGEVLDRIRPRSTPYACMLGGERGDRLFIAAADTDDPAEAKRLLSGRIELV
ncbi:MAG: SMP-30/gluconolactonase/LRE family protein [Chromatiales bacterium]|nr:SMP-30/gluconolactonase/LRE family protein [Chromatiales bacterium]